MTRFINYCLKLKEYFILVLLIITSLIIIYQNNNIQLKQVRSISVQFLGFVQENFSTFFKTIWIPHIFYISKENQILRENNLVLSEEVSRLREASLENIRLRALIKFKENPKFEHLSAKIIGKSLVALKNHITLDVGSKDGITQFMPIVTDKGLVGKIINVANNYSVGQIMKNKDFKVSVIDERSRIAGIMSWEGSENFIMNEVAKNLDVKVGDVIITSNYSSIFPPNIPVGIVSSVNINTGNLFQYIQIKSNVDFNTIEECFVLLTPADSTKINLENLFYKKEN